ncbi:helix-turn-helix domain-containing protein [Enterococcus sp. ALS3]|uniref:Helix-turn-helix domain-containing protein n=1 Tax=Enterococcus alishanensis TaxID=1303817 RepID=A0ABS6TE31_9ENTE|nr:helix-turn-helix domain-containing protein [Enterococcus alishanensis]MBV7391089.1 helix-turn-helix domain-containing protein [Enterococcus alishanensis]
MADAKETRQKILNHFKDNGWSIPDVATAMNITEQYLRKILNNPDDHWKQITNIVSKYKIR